MDILHITESIGDLVAKYPRHAGLFWCTHIDQAGWGFIYSVKCDEEHDDGWNIDCVVCGMVTESYGEAVVDAHNASVVAALNKGEQCDADARRCPADI